VVVLTSSNLQADVDRPTTLGEFLPRKTVAFDEMVQMRPAIRDLLDGTEPGAQLESSGNQAGGVHHLVKAES